MSLQIQFQPLSDIIALMNSPAIARGMKNITYCGEHEEYPKSQIAVHIERGYFLYNRKNIDDTFTQARGMKVSEYTRSCEIIVRFIPTDEDQESYERDPQDTICFGLAMKLLPILTDNAYTIIEEKYGKKVQNKNIQKTYSWYLSKSEPFEFETSDGRKGVALYTNFIINVDAIPMVPLSTLTQQ